MTLYDPCHRERIRHLVPSAASQESGRFRLSGSNTKAITIQVLEASTGERTRMTRCRLQSKAVSRSSGAPSTSISVTTASTCTTRYARPPAGTMLLPARAAAARDEDSFRRSPSKTGGMESTRELALLARLRPNLRERLQSRRTATKLILCL